MVMLVRYFSGINTAPESVSIVTISTAAADMVSDQPGEVTGAETGLAIMVHRQGGSMLKVVEAKCSASEKGGIITALLKEVDRMMIILSTRADKLDL